MTTAVADEQMAGSPWWLVLIEGVALIILGLLFMTNTAQTTIVFIQMLGIYWLLRGIFDIIRMFMDHTAWGWRLFSGIIGIIAGIVILQHPLLSPFVVGSVLIIILGIQGIIGGGIGIYQAFKGAGWGVGILGAVSILIGLWLLANIGQATFVLPWVVGIFAIIGGIIAIVMAFRLR